MPKLWGDILNRIAECGENARPEIGMGVTMFDEYGRMAHEVVGICGPDRIKVRRLNAINKAEWPKQDYEFESNPEFPVFELSRKNGRWKYYVTNTSASSVGWIVGYADEYRADGGRGLDGTVLEGKR